MATKTGTWSQTLRRSDTGEEVSTTVFTATLTYTESFSGSSKIITLTHVDVKCSTTDTSQGHLLNEPHHCTSCCGVHSLVCQPTGKVLTSFNRLTQTNSMRNWFPKGAVTYGTDINITRTIPSGGSINIEVIRYNRGDCSPTNYTVSFSNPVTPPSLNVTCAASATSAATGSFNAGGSIGNCPAGQATTRWTLYRGTNASGSVERSGTTSSETFSGLLPNQSYFITVSRSNSCGSANGSCSFTTLTPNTITNEQATAWDTICARLFVTFGGGQYDPTTQIQYRKKGASAWSNGPTSTTKSAEEFCIEGLEEETCYEIRAQTRTPAGTYTGNTVTVCTPKKCVQGSFTSVKVSLNERTWETYADVCFDYSSYMTPATVWVEYRPLNGYDNIWYKSDVINVTGTAPVNGSACVVLHDLFPNLVTYEYRLVGEAENCHLEGDPSQFVTPMVPEPDPVKVCEVLTYLVELLCASVHRLYEGNKTIFANEYSKELCDPYNLEPTNLTLWSRFLRWAWAVKCVTCNMAEAGLKYGKENQYYVGEAGWIDLLEEVLEEMDQESWRLVTSEAILKYIQKKIHEVWHYHTDIDYFVTTLDDAPDDATTVLNLEDNKAYKKVGGEWVLLPDDMQPDNFAVFHMNKESKGVLPSGTTASAGSAWYYFEGTWQPLDFQNDDIEAVLSELEEIMNKAVRNEENADHLKMYVVDKDFNYNTLPCERAVCYVTEDMDQPEPTYYTITFEAGTTDAEAISTTPQPQKVLSGALGIQPASPIYDKHTLVRWVDKDTGQAFNWSSPVTKDYTLVAEWRLSDYIIKFNPNGGSPTPPDQSVPVGSRATQPTGVTRNGYDLDCWEY